MYIENKLKLKPTYSEVCTFGPVEDEDINKEAVGCPFTGFRPSSRHSLQIIEYPSQTRLLCVKLKSIIKHLNEFPFYEYVYGLHEEIGDKVRCILNSRK
ncbi:hypothetical protein ACTXT7_017447 [Hymenolepis weldensis]